MAKELPYFKFEPAIWDAGNIQQVSRNSKGLFIDICSLYWIRLGELPYALALQKLCNGDASYMQELCDVDIIGINNGQIIIEFLDEQLNEFQETSKKRADAANKRWNHASALQKQCKSNAIREDKRREDKIKEDKIKEKERFKPPSVSDVDHYMYEKGLSRDEAAIQSESFVDYYINKNWKVGKANTQMKDWQAAVRNWLKNDFNKPKNLGYGKQKHADSPERQQIREIAKNVDQSDW